MLTHDGDARRKTHDDGRQPIAIGHLSDSGDLKIRKTHLSNVHELHIKTTFQLKIWNLKFRVAFPSQAHFRCLPMSSLRTRGIKIETITFMAKVKIHTSSIQRIVF